MSRTRCPFCHEMIASSKYERQIAGLLENKSQPRNRRREEDLDDLEEVDELDELDELDDADDYLEEPKNRPTKRQR